MRKIMSEVKKQAVTGFKIVKYGDAKALEDAVTPNTIAFLVEPIQGEGGG